MLDKKLSTIIVLVIILLFMVGCSNGNEIEKNNAEIVQAIDNIAAPTVFLDELVSFGWDSLYVFPPYATVEKILETTGIKFHVKGTYSEGTNQMMFIKDNQVVCYLSGYPEDNGIFFKFDFPNSEYLKFYSADKLEFDIERTDEKTYTTLKYRLE